MRYDAIVIGSGPAGLSAAITLKIRNKSVLVIGNATVSAKVEKAHEIQNYLGIPAIKGADLAQKFLDHAAEMGVEIKEEHVLNAYDLGGYYSLATRSGNVYEGTTLVLATGVNFGRPYPGEDEYLGRGVSYCATCDAPLYKQKSVIIIGTTPKEEEEAEFMSEVASEVVYIPTYKDEVNLPESVKVIREVPAEIKGQMKANTLVLKNGEELTADGIFILREGVSPSALVPGLEVENNHVAVNRKMETSLPGVFACGDITGAPYQYIKSAGEGNVAALSVVDYIAKVNKANAEA